MGVAPSRSRRSSTRAPAAENAAGGTALQRQQYPNPYSAQGGTQQYYPQPQGYYPGQAGAVNNGGYYGGRTGAQPQRGPAPYQQQVAPRVQEQTQRTNTIRNHVNLKKTTLEAVPVSGSDPNSGLVVKFTFDAAAACSVSVFFVATEHPHEAFKVTPASGTAPVRRHDFDKGLGQVFTLPAPEALKPGKFSDAELTEALGDRVPIIVRMETVTGDSGNSLPEPPGASLQPWVQSQTTYATLEKKDDGSYGVRIIKQKIWVEAVSYELQEIYGIENCAATGTPAGGGAGDDGKECVVCLSEPRDTTVLPCRHMCMCSGCARMLRHQSNRCPICRTAVESLLEIKVDRSRPAEAPAA
mmetsp:Transcript_23010/g.78357  ORF Transcript_23010/g.78357 Transcript_23010/m.78357 type:complete len:355 (+) Transcript_23010:287-1351(+)